MTKPVSRFMSIFVLLNVTLIEIDWPMPCWRTLSGFNGLTFQNLNLNFREPDEARAFAISSNSRHNVITLNIVIIRSYSNWRIDCWVVHRSYGLKFVTRAHRIQNRSPWQIKILTWSPQIKEWAKSIPRKLLFRHDSFIVILIWCVLDSLCGVHVNSKRSTLLPSSSWQCGIWRPSEKLLKK